MLARAPVIFTEKGLAAGQSGNWTSPHYRDLFPLWHSGQYFPLLFSRQAVEQATTQKITLVP